MTEQEERFIHLLSCIRDLNSARRILLEIKQCKIDNSVLVGAAFRFALIEYAKPYTSSHGSVSNHKLSDRHVPSRHGDLHRRILSRRNQIHAHSDLTVRDAKLYIAKSVSGRQALITENLIYGTEEMDRIDEIVSLVEETLENLYEEEKRLESQLPLS